MHIKKKPKLKQWFCKHDYVDAKKRNSKLFDSIDGLRIYTVCTKCGKIKGSYLRKHEGNESNRAEE